MHADRKRGSVGAAALLVRGRREPLTQAARRFGLRIAAWSRLAQVGVWGAFLALSAFSMALSSGSPGARWIGWVALLPLLQAVRRCRPNLAAVAGAFWGLSLFIAAPQVGAAEFRAEPLNLALLTLIPAAYAGLGAALTRRIGFSPYLLALGWMGVEFAFHPLGLGNGVLAKALDDGLALRILGSVAGYALVAFVVAYINAALLCVLSQVRFTGGTTRFSRGGSGGVRSLSGWDTLVPVHAFLRQLRPRGPPAAAPALAFRA